MKFSRRGAMSVGVGGIVAAPGLARQATQQMDKPHYPTNHYDESPAASILQKNQANLEYIERSKKELTKAINGELEQWQQIELDSIDIDYQWSYNIDDLKSVSNSHKIQMKKELIKKRKRQDWIRSAKRRLSSLLSGRGVG